MLIPLLLINIGAGIINFNSKNYKTASFSFFVCGMLTMKIIIDFIN